MKVSISTDYEYTGKDSPQVESFNLVVEGDERDFPKDTAKTYLKLRKRLRKVIKEVV